VASPSACSTLVPDKWAEGVGHADMSEIQSLETQPTDDLKRLQAWTKYALAEAERVEQADGRTKDTISIVRGCEDRDKKAVEKSRPKLLGIIPR